ncbi:hypothetical protein MKX01_037598 [Papaver californicum]|nr:hypothetical protein MKX01_037598 [Papaver californicum]
MQFTLKFSLNSYLKPFELVLAYAGMGQAAEAMEMMLSSFVGPAEGIPHQCNLYFFRHVLKRALALNYISLIFLCCLVGVGLGGNSPTTNNNLYIDVLMTSFAEFPRLLLAAATVDRIAHKLSISTVFFTCCIFLLPLMFDQPENLTTALLFGARICITGTFIVVYIYALEVSQLGGIICTMVAVGLLHGFHQTPVIFLFEVVLFLARTAVIFFPFETKGCELIDNSVISSSSSKSNISL